MNEIFALIADLARATAAWEGGAREGVAYTAHRWRQELADIAARAEALAADRGASPDTNAGANRVRAQEGEAAAAPEK